MSRIHPISEGTSNRIANAGLIAALMVVFIHTDIQASCPAHVQCLVGIVKTAFCTMAIPTFFMISGYLLAGHADDAGWWILAIKKRLITLGIPYLLWGTLFFALDYFRSYDASFTELLKSLGLTTCEMPGLYPLWFVRSLLALVLISPILVWCVARFKLSFLGALFFLSLARPIIAQCASTFMTIAQSIFVVCGGMFWFSIGLYLRQCGSLPNCSVRQITFLVISGSILTVTGATCEMFNFPTGRTCCLLLGTPTLIAGLWKVVPTARWPQWLIRCAFPIFVLHVFALGAYNNLLGPEVNSIPSFAAKYGSAIALPIAFTAVVRNLTPRFAGMLFGGRC